MNLLGRIAQPMSLKYTLLVSICEPTRSAADGAR
jgi:hypothetical protein